MSRLTLAVHVLLHGRLPGSENVTVAAASPDTVDEPATLSSEPAPDPASASGAAVPAVATDRLIDLRDNVLIATDTVEGPGGAALASVARQLTEVLRLTGVEVFDDTGPFDDRRHHIAGMVPTTDPALEQVIAESVRSGCLRDGELLRRQQVLVYEVQDRHDG